MVRVSIIAAVAIFCVLTARPPDPRLLAALEALDSNHSHQVLDDADGSYYCPMEPDVRSIRPGKCRRCGMTLVEGVPDIVEYPLELGIAPAVPRIDSPTRLTFGLVDPRTDKPVRSFEIVHEKLYHAFVVSQDLSFFVHAHPERQPDEDFHLDVRFPKPGMYRVLSDFYPTGGTPQLITNTVIVPGAGATLAPANIRPDLTGKDTENSHVELELTPAQTIAGENVRMSFRVQPDEGMEPYLGAWGHMLAASADLADMVHHHPIAAVDLNRNGGKELQFEMAFPRAGVYRVWVQFQRRGVVNTVAFNVPVDFPAH